MLTQMGSLANVVNQDPLRSLWDDPKQTDPKPTKIWMAAWSVRHSNQKNKGRIEKANYKIGVADKIARTEYNRVLIERIKRTSYLGSSHRLLNNMKRIHLESSCQPRSSLTRVCSLWLTPSTQWQNFKNNNVQVKANEIR